jgi:hypothetical protein
LHFNQFRLDGGGIEEQFREILVEDLFAVVFDPL